MDAADPIAYAGIVRSRPPRLKHDVTSRRQFSSNRFAFLPHFGAIARVDDGQKQMATRADIVIAVALFRKCPFPLDQLQRRRPRNACPSQVELSLRSPSWGGRRAAWRGDRWQIVRWHPCLADVRCHRRPFYPRPGDRSASPHLCSRTRVSCNRPVSWQQLGRRAVASRVIEYAAASESSHACWRFTPDPAPFRLPILKRYALRRGSQLDVAPDLAPI